MKAAVIKSNCSNTQREQKTIVKMIPTIQGTNRVRKLHSNNTLYLDAKFTVRYGPCEDITRIK